MSASRLKKGSIALFVGCLIIYAGDHLLGVRPELFLGLATFSVWWILDIFVVPFVAGIAVSIIYGMGGKWLAHFPPLIIRFYGYFETMKLIGIPEGTALTPLGWWGFFVILSIESATIGGVVGELLIKRTYGRGPIHLEFQKKAARAEEKSQTDA